VADNAVPATVANEALVTTPLILDAVTYEAVWAVVMNTDEDTHEALTAVMGINEMEVATEALAA
jgi:glycine cleavage system H lipoate-binding protein